MKKAKKRTSPARLFANRRRANRARSRLFAATALPRQADECVAVEQMHEFMLNSPPIKDVDIRALVNEGRD